MLAAQCMGISGLVKGVPSGNIYCLMAYLWVWDSEKKELIEWFTAYGNEDKRVYQLKRGEFTIL